MGFGPFQLLGLHTQATKLLMMLNMFGEPAGDPKTMRTGSTAWQ